MHVAGGGSTDVGVCRPCVVIEAHGQERRRTHDTIAGAEHGRLVVEELRAGCVSRTVGVMSANDCTVDGSTSSADSPAVSQSLHTRRLTTVTRRHVVGRLVVIRSQQPSRLAVVPTAQTTARTTSYII